MCRIFVSADPALYTPVARSIRLSGVATSLRLEQLYWQILEEIAARDALTVPQLLGRLFDELAEAGGLERNANFTSFLRVSCMRYLQLQLAGRIPASVEVPIRSLDADWVLAGERGHAAQARYHRDSHRPESPHVRLQRP